MEVPPASMEGATNTPIYFSLPNVLDARLLWDKSTMRELMKVGRTQSGCSWEPVEVGGSQSR